MLLDILLWYLFFCSVTSIYAVIINIKVFIREQVAGPFLGILAYLLTTLILAFIGAPLFFVALIFYSEIYEESIVNSINNA